MVPAFNRLDRERGKIVGRKFASVVQRLEQITHNDQTMVRLHPEAQILLVISF